LTVYVKWLISKKFEKDTLQTIYKKKKWMQKSSVFLNVLILKDTEDSDNDSKGSDSDSDKSSDSEGSGSDKESSSSSCPEIDLKSSHSSFSYDKKSKVISCNSGSWYTCIAKKSNR